MFGWGRKSAVEERAQKIARLVEFIRHGMRTKTYEQFVATFSNPGAEPDRTDRFRRQLNFTMTISPACWYQAMAMYPHGADDKPFLSMQGGGDDFGVFITAGADTSNYTEVDLHLFSGQKAGRDASAMVRALLRIEGWQRAGALERALGIDID